jgi:hypothetical protein
MIVKSGDRVSYLLCRAYESSSHVLGMLFYYEGFIYYAAKPEPVIPKQIKFSQDGKLAEVTL